MRIAECGLRILKVAEVGLLKVALGIVVIALLPVIFPLVAFYAIGHFTIKGIRESIVRRDRQSKIENRKS